MIVFLTKDLMMSSNARSLAKEHEVQLKLADSNASVLKMIDDHRPHVLLVDLQTQGLDVEKLGADLRELADSLLPVTIAYAQHVNVQLLEQAKSSGFDQVMTRGQFNKELASLMAQTS